MNEQSLKLSSETQNLVEYLRKKIDEQQNGFKSRRNKNRNLAIRIKLALIILSAIVTILLGIRNESVTAAFTNLAFVISAAITALTAVEEFFEYRGLWVRYNITFVQLKSLQEDLEYLILRENDEKKLKSELDELHKKFKDILEITNAEWLSMRKKDVEK
jgi:hypothetical protein